MTWDQEHLPKNHPVGIPAVTHCASAGVDVFTGQLCATGRPGSERDWR
jgi:hypothetical protein